MTTTGTNSYKTSGETPVANINYRIYRPFPSTNQVLMVYRTGNNFTVSGSGATRVRGLTFRLNSINDCFTDYTYSANPDPSTGDTIDATPNVPSMRNFWSTVYRYYTVVRSRFHFRIRPNNQTAAIALDEMDIYMHLHGIQRPPDLDSAGNPIPWKLS